MMSPAVEEEALPEQTVVESLHGAGFDHPDRPAFPEDDYLKFAIGRVR